MEHFRVRSQKPVKHTRVAVKDLGLGSNSDNPFFKSLTSKLTYDADKTFNNSLTLQKPITAITREKNDLA